MTQLRKNELCICIPDTQPAQRREWLIKAIAAAMRWNADVSSDTKYENDGENLYILAQLLEALTIDD